MERTFDLLRGEASGESVADAAAAIAASPGIDLAALVARLNSIDAKINGLESKINESLAAQVAPAPEPQQPEADAVQASQEIAGDDDPGTPEPDAAPADDKEE